jgi:hypothetical protein
MSSHEPGRWGVWCLMSGTLLANFTVRYALPPLQLFIAQELQLGEAQRAALLGAFFSGVRFSTAVEIHSVRVVVTRGLSWCNTWLSWMHSTSPRSFQRGWPCSAGARSRS